MCVTNIAKRNPRTVAVAHHAMVASTPSVVSQRLMGNFMPLMLNTTISKPISAGVPTFASTNHLVEQRAQQQVVAPITALNLFPSHSIPADQEEKRRPKRRRKPQKPGKTAKLNDRHFVVHNYHDHAFEYDENDEDENENRRRGGVSISFPTKLHSVLEQVEADGLAHIVSWQTHGRCFVIHKPKEFTDHVMPHYFRQTKLTSFQRQLNLYGFCRLTRGKDSGGYYHELFLRGRPGLAKKMQRTKIKGTKFKAASSPDQEPDFYSMPPVPENPQTVSDDSSFDGSEVEDSCTAGIAYEPVTYEPFPFQVARPPVAPSLEPFPSLTNARFTASVLFADLGLKRKPADDILDEAVEEIFSNNPSLGDTREFDEIWDGTEFGEESVHDDLQLGYMLEKLLGE